MSFSKNILSYLIFHSPININEGENNVIAIRKKLKPLLNKELTTFLKKKNLSSKDFFKYNNVFLLKFNQNDIRSPDFDNYCFVFYESKLFKDILFKNHLALIRLNYLNYNKMFLPLNKIKEQTFEKILLQEFQNPNSELFFLKDNVFITDHLPRLEVIPISIFDCFK